MVWKSSNFFVAYINQNSSTIPNTMGKDYRHNRGRKSERFDEDYDSRMRKLESYDRNKGRKKNKINLNQVDVYTSVDTEDESEMFEAGDGIFFY